MTHKQLITIERCAIVTAVAAVLASAAVTLRVFRDIVEEIDDVVYS